MIFALKKIFYNLYVTNYNLYVTSYNLFFSGWRHIGDGHYHFFEQKEYKQWQE